MPSTVTARVTVTRRLGPVRAAACRQRAECLPQERTVDITVAILGSGDRGATVDPSPRHGRRVDSERHRHVSSSVRGDDDFLRDERRLGPRAEGEHFDAGVKAS
jgi:hypothetical protein